MGIGMRKRRRGKILATATEFGTTAAIWLGVGLAVPGTSNNRIGVVVGALVAAGVTALLLERGRASTPMAVSQVEDVRHVAANATMATVAALIVCLLIGHRLGILTPLLALALTFLTLLCVRGVVRRLRSRFGSATNVIIVGTGVDATEVAELLVDHPEARLHLVGVIGHFATAERNGLEPLWLGEVEDLAAVIASESVTEAIVLPTAFRSIQFREILSQLSTAGIEPLLSTGVARLSAPALKVNALIHEPLVRVQATREQHRAEIAVGRVLDVAGASVLLLLASPIVLITALAIKLDSRGPVFYRSARIGVGHKDFGMYKLRSMTADADERKNELANRNERSGPLFKVSNDPRITRVGKFIRETSIDELPQFLNVILGHMALVGPRPALPEEAAAFDDELQARFAYRPGITGLWQVEARSNASFEAYRRLDLHYIKTKSLVLDLQILIATATQVVVSVILIPVGIVMRAERTDGVQNGGIVPSPGTVIDLRDRAQAKFEAHSAERGELEAN